MNCSEVKLQLYELLEEGGPAAPRSEALRHLAQCPSCLSLWNQLQSLVQEVKELPDPKIPPEWTAGVIDMIHSQFLLQRQRQRFARFGLFPAAAALVMASVAVLAGFMSLLFAAPIFTIASVLNIPGAIAQFLGKLINMVHLALCASASAVLSLQVVMRHMYPLNLYGVFAAFAILCVLAYWTHWLQRGEFSLQRNAITGISEVVR